MRGNGDRSIPGDTSASVVPLQVDFFGGAAPPSLVLLAHAGGGAGQEERGAAQAAEGQELRPQGVEDVGDEEAPPDVFGGLVGEGRAGVQRGAQVGELSLGTQGGGFMGCPAPKLPPRAPYFCIRRLAPAYFCRNYPL